MRKVLFGSVTINSCTIVDGIVDLVLLMSTDAPSIVVECYVILPSRSTPMHY